MRSTIESTIESSMDGHAHRHWQRLFRAQMQAVGSTASDEFFMGLQRVGFRPGQMPSLPELSRRVRQATQWQLKAVGVRPGPRQLFLMLAARQFPIRTDFSLAGPLPGYFEDVFGYAPLLTNAAYSEFLLAFGKVGVGHSENGLKTRPLHNALLHIMDHGFVREGGDVRAIGGRLLANATPGFWAQAQQAYVPLDVDHLLNTRPEPTWQQPYYTLVPALSQLPQLPFELAGALVYLQREAA